MEVNKRWVGLFTSLSCLRWFLSSAHVLQECPSLWDLCREEAEDLGVCFQCTLRWKEVTRDSGHRRKDIKDSLILCALGIHMALPLPGLLAVDFSRILGVSISWRQCSLRPIQLWDPKTFKHSIEGLVLDCKKPRFEGKDHKLRLFFFPIFTGFS